MTRPAEPFRTVCRGRLARLVHLRQMKAPRWIVRSEQVALATNRRGLKVVGIGKTPNQYQGALTARYVVPLLESA